MASCTWKSTVSGAPYATLTVTQNSRSTENNYSVIAYSLVLYRPYSVSSSAAKSYSVTINGTKVKSGTVTIGGSGNKTIVSGTTNVYHDADGTKTLSFSFSLALELTWNGSWIGTAAADGSTSLVAIPRASEVSVSAQLGMAPFGSALTITCNRASNSFTHTLTYRFGDATGTIATNVGTSCSWIPPWTLASQIPDSTRGNCVITCTTYNGSTVIGTDKTGFNLYIPANKASPSVETVTISEATEGLAAKFGTYVQNKSKLAVSVTGSGKYGSTIKSYSVEIESTTYAGSSITSELLTSSGTVDVVARVTDSRGKVGVKTTTVLVAEYFAPIINSMQARRINTSGDDATEGTRIAVCMSYAVASVNNKNDRSCVLKYKKSTDSDFTTFSSGTASATYNGTQKFTSAPEISTDYAYTIRLEISDYFQTTVYECEISTGFTLLDFRSTGKGVAIGKVSEKDKLEVAMVTEFYSLVNCHAYDPPNEGAVTGYQQFYRTDGSVSAYLTVADDDENGVGLSFWDKDGKYTGTIRVKGNGDIDLPAQGYEFTLKSYFTLNRATVSRQGNVVTIYASVKYVGALNAGTNIEVGSVPEDLAPANSVATAGLQGSTNTCSAWVQNTGKIWLRPHANSVADDAFEFMLAYNKAASWQTPEEVTT